MIRVGILTYFASINYGAFLQAYALQAVLDNRYGMYADIEIINFDSKIAHERYQKKVNSYRGKPYVKARCQYNKFIDSRDKQKISKHQLVSDDILEAQDFLRGKYDIIVVGSDEVWKTDSFRGFPTPYWLNFELDGTTYMTYAVSGRNDYQKMNDNMRLYIQEALNRFSYIGVRDEVTRKELLKLTSKEIHRNCDPTLLRPQLFQRNEEEKTVIRKKYKIKSDKPLVSLMLRDKLLGSQLYRMLNYENQVLYLCNINENIKEGNLVELSPFEWSDIIAISDLVITDYFHGTLFSIIHEVPFLSIENEIDGRGKKENLLIENFMEDKLIYLKNYEKNMNWMAIDIYTRARREMRHYDNLLAQQAKKRELEKGNHFFSAFECEVRKRY